MAKLIVAEKGLGRESTFEINPDGLTIGRADESNLKINEKSVSRLHARIVIEGGDFFLLDMGSGNGTYLNGAKVQSNERALLRHGDIISIGNHNLKFSQIDEMLQQSFNEVTDSDILEVKLLKKVLRAIDKESIPSIEVLNGNFVGKKFFITDEIEEFIIGRDAEANFQVEEYVISRKHAKVVRKNHEFVLQDLQSKNGSYVNNRQVTEVVLHDGDRIAFGTIVLIFRNPKEVNLEAVSEKMKREMEEERIIRQAARKQPEKATPPVAEDEEFSSTAEGLMEEAPPIPEEIPEDYPMPKPRKEAIKLSYFELGMIGFGLLIFIFAIVSFINLIAK